MEHLRRGTPGIQELFLGHRILVDDTDGGIDSHFRIHDGRLIHRDTNVLVQEADDRGHGVVNDHAAGVQHTPYHVNGVLGGGKPVRDLDAAPAVHDDLDIVVGVDVHLLHTGLVDPFL